MNAYTVNNNQRYQPSQMEEGESFLANKGKLLEL